MIHVTFLYCLSQHLVVEFDCTVTHKHLLKRWENAGVGRICVIIEKTGFEALVVQHRGPEGCLDGG